MATTTQSQTDQQAAIVSGDKRVVLGRQFQEAYDAQNPLRLGWDEKESMLISKLGDSMSPSFKSRVTDSRLATIVIDRAARVAAQLPTGTVQALTKKDKGKSALMGLVLNKYIQVYANAQYDHLTKIRMWDMYSQVYGVQPMLYDYDIRDDYIGPDMWLLQIRKWFPQPGKTSIDDSNHNFIESEVSLSFLEGRDPKVWNKAEVDYVVEMAKKGGKSKTNKDANKKSVVEQQRELNISGGIGPAAQVTLVTKYESGPNGHWITFAPDFDNRILRDIPNPHKNGKIPIVLKHHFPLIDSIYGLGAFERGKTLQFAADSLINLYLDGVKMSIFPPLIIQQDQVVASSIKYQPGAKWLEKSAQAIRQWQGNPQGLQTFQATYQFLIGALQSQNGVTDTSVSSENSNDPTFGKTPAAISLQQQRESAADNWDRFQLEKSLECLYGRMINLVSMNQEKPINLHIFDAEIQQLKDAGLDDVMEVFESKKAAKITITKNGSGKGKIGIGGCDYCYFIDSSTTMQKNQEAEHQTLGEILTMLVKAPQLISAMQAEGKQVSIAETFKQWLISSGAGDWEKLITDIKKPTAAADAANSGPQGAPVPPPAGQPPVPAGVDPQQLMQILSGQQAPAPEAPQLPPDHPARLMESLNIALDKMPQDFQRFIFKSVFNFESTDATPAAAKTAVDQAKAIIDAHKADSTVQNTDATTLIKAHDSVHGAKNSAAQTLISAHTAAKPAPELETPAEDAGEGGVEEPMGDLSARFKVPTPEDHAILANSTDPATQKLASHLYSHLGGK